MLLPITQSGQVLILGKSAYAYLFFPSLYGCIVVAFNQ